MKILEANWTYSTGTYRRAREFRLSFRIISFFGAGRLGTEGDTHPQVCSEGEHQGSRSCLLGFAFALHFLNHFFSDLEDGHFRISDMK